MYRSHCILNHLVTMLLSKHFGLTIHINKTAKSVCTNNTISAFLGRHRVFTSSASSNCHLVSRRYYIILTQRFSHDTSLSPAAVITTAWWYIVVVWLYIFNLKTFNIVYTKATWWKLANFISSVTCSSTSCLYELTLYVCTILNM